MNKLKKKKVFISTKTPLGKVQILEGNVVRVKQSHIKYCANYSKQFSTLSEAYQAYARIGFDLTRSTVQKISKGQ